MRALPMLGEFDLVTCLDDALNYLHTRDELVAAFSGIARNLARPGGVAVFDMNSLLAYETFFGALSVVAADGLVLVWRGRCSVPLAAGGFAEATIEALRRDDEGVWTTSSHDHRQRHHPREMVESALAVAGLRVLRLGAMRRDGTLVVDGFDEHEHTKAIYVVEHGLT
jgi:SAM-dependent methyltransferase